MGRGAIERKGGEPVGVRMREIAQRAGVSTATVSRVLSRASNAQVSDETRRRVEATAAELGYQPNHVARSLRTKRSRIIGVVIPDIQNPFFIGVVRAIQDSAYERHHAVFLCNTDEDRDKAELCVELMQAERVAGVIVSPVGEVDDPCRRFAESGVPMVVVDRRLPGLNVDTVLVDNRGATRELVAHLIADGHQRIGAVIGNPAVTTGRERREGFLDAVAAFGLPSDPALVKVGPANEANREAVGYRLTRELLDLTEPPTALFTGTNLLTVGALKAIQGRGLRIPEDIALVAFDEIDWMSLVRPAMTVAAQPMAELGRTAATLLFQRIDDETRPVEEIVFRPTLVIRQSCANHAAADIGPRG